MTCLLLILVLNGEVLIGYRSVVLLLVLGIISVQSVIMRGVRIVKFGVGRLKLV